MGCTPSSSAGVYSHDTVCRDLDTCSTFVPSVKSSVSTPERPRPSLDHSDTKQTFLRVPRRDAHGRSVSQSSALESWSSADCVAPSPGRSSSSCGVQNATKPRTSPEAPHTHTEESGPA